MSYDLAVFDPREELRERSVFLACKTFLHRASSQ
jgi:hypothetical protein